MSALPTVSLPCFKFAPDHGWWSKMKQIEATG
jgi:hypothetical protein